MGGWSFYVQYGRLHYTHNYVNRAYYTVSSLSTPAGLSCGANPGSRIAPGYRAPFRFTGTVHTVTLDLPGDLITDTEADMRIAMTRQ